jgi:hypothetical protein
MRIHDLVNTLEETYPPVRRCVWAGQTSRLRHFCAGATHSLGFISGCTNPREFGVGGFNSLGIHCVTGTKFDPEGFDCFRYSAGGISRWLFRRDGYHATTGKRYGPEGHDCMGFWPGREVYGPHGYDAMGFNAELRHRDTGLLTCPRGYKANAFHAATGRHLNGTFRDQNGITQDGFDMNDFNVFTGLHRNGTKYGPDRSGMLRDVSGFNRYKICRNGAARDEHGLSADGFSDNGLHYIGFWHPVTGDLDQRYTPDGFDERGVRWDGFDGRGVYVKTGEMVDGRGFKANGFSLDGVHKATGRDHDTYGRKERELDALGDPLPARPAMGGGGGFVPAAAPARVAMGGGGGGAGRRMEEEGW